MNRLIRVKKATPLFVVTFVLACFALLGQARADCREGCDTNNGNTFLGDDALLHNSIGHDNTATGLQALSFNTTGIFNTANGSTALFFNTTGEINTATGGEALLNNSTGGGNTANGFEALRSNTAGDSNTATGVEALLGNTTGSNNTASGLRALYNNTTGANNIALGYQAGQNLTTGDNNINIGNEGAPGQSNAIRIGTQGTQVATYVAGISGVNIGKGLVVEVDASGQLGTRGSSRRFKDEIKPMDKASEAILALKPVTFRYKKEIDPDGTPQFGLVAEQVEKVSPDLIVRDHDGKPYSVRYEAVNAMLLNEFLKEHKTVQKQGAIIARQQKQIEALTAGLQKVSAQLATASPSLADLK
jgi:hypothetical protein